MKKRGFIVSDTLAWWIIGIVVLVLSLVFYIVLREKGTNILEFLKNLVRFR